jgi:hypothetical protein
VKSRFADGIGGKRETRVVCTGNEMAVIDDLISKPCLQQEIDLKKAESEWTLQTSLLTHVYSDRWRSL